MRSAWCEPEHRRQMYSSGSYHHDGHGWHRRYRRLRNDMRRCMPVLRDATALNAAAAHRQPGGGHRLATQAPRCKSIALVDDRGHPRTPSHGAHVLRTGATTRGNRRSTGSFAQDAAIMATDCTLLRLGVKSVRLTWCAVLFQWKPRWLHVHRGFENCWRPAWGLERTASAHLQATDPGRLQPFDSEMPMTAEWPTAVIA